MSNRIDIAGVPFDPLTYEEAVNCVQDFVQSRRQAHIVTPNPEMVLLAQHDPRFMEVLRNASLSTIDGAGILWAIRYLGRPAPRNRLAGWIQFLFLLATFPFVRISGAPTRITGTDLMEKLIVRAETTGWNIFLLGAEEGVAREAVRRLSLLYPKARFAGAYSGSPNPHDASCICPIINEAAPDLLFVAFGHPKQELWIRENLSRLPSVKAAMGVGGAFDFFAGAVKRAPAWMRRMGLEWLWRLFLDPSRIGRIINATVRFPWMIKQYSASACLKCGKYSASACLKCGKD